MEGYALPTGFDFERYARDLARGEPRAKSWISVTPGDIARTLPFLPLIDPQSSYRFVQTFTKQHLTQVRVEGHRAPQRLVGIRETQLLRSWQACRV